MVSFVIHHSHLAPQIAPKILLDFIGVLITSKKVCSIGPFPAALAIHEGVETGNFLFVYLKVIVAVHFAPAINVYLKRNMCRFMMVSKCFIQRPANNALHDELTPKVTGL